ncbi:Histone-lysine N-methyltransferase SETMAR [Eumeta japonica]|uniref:Histone-lysine N-methyltransferase SETMAR n=1 Tax=Eumeta variegata TaxID=151549 RepID=A0A4C1UQQ5_EUMVA|nr:Histone-lysine N-methyltransferase SETMAR [Eumeta japonica]
MVKKWFTEFRCGRTSTSDAERSGRSKEVITPEIVDKIHEMILDDRRMKVRELVHAVGISTERVHHILHEYLDMRKLSAKWVPRLLTLDHKRNRVTTSKECLAMFSRNPDEFSRRFVTMDETWIHHNTPETKEQSKQWVSRVNVDQRRPNRVCQPTRFAVDFKQKRPHLAKKKVLFHQDNACVHTCLVTMAKIHELRYELLPHPAYSPDLAPCDYYLFPNLKKWLSVYEFRVGKTTCLEAIQLLHKNESVGQLGHVPSNGIGENQMWLCQLNMVGGVELPIEAFPDCKGKRDRVASCATHCGVIPTRQLF